jgi:hypothetical protein
MGRFNDETDLPGLQGHEGISSAIVVWCRVSGGLLFGGRCLPAMVRLSHVILEVAMTDRGNQRLTSIVAGEGRRDGVGIIQWQH